MRRFSTAAWARLCLPMAVIATAYSERANAAPGGTKIQVQMAPQAERIYQISYHGQAQFDYGLLADSLSSNLGSVKGSSGKVVLQTINYDLTAELHWRVLETTAKGSMVAARLQNVNYRMNDVADTRRDMLEAPFLVRFDAQGAIRELSFVRHYPRDLAAAVRSFVEPLQVVVGKANGASWTTSEREGESTYAVRYDVTNVDATRAQIKKTKTKVIISSVAEAQLALTVAPVANVAASEATIAWSLTGGLERIDLRDHVIVTSAKRLVSDDEHSYSATRIERPLATLATTLAAARAELADASFARARLYDVDADVLPKIKGFTVNDAMAAFTTAIGQNYAVAHRLLKNFIRLHPESVDDVAERLETLARSTPDTDDAGVTLIGFGWAAMSSAGHPEAQATLIKAATEEGRAALTREKALIAIMDLQLPEVSTVTQLWSFRETLPETGATAAITRSIAANAYGALGDIQKGNLDITNMVVEKLGARLKSAGDLREKVLMVDALTNVGDFERVEPLVAPLFSASDAKLRAQAFKTFRRMTGDHAFARFAQRFSAEADVAVRRQATRVVLDMGDSAARNSWAANALASTQDAETKELLIRIVGEGLKFHKHSENEQVLRDVLRDTRDRKLRRAIYAFIAPAKTGGDR